MVGVFVVHVRPGQGAGAPWVQPSSSVHHPVNSISNLMMDMRTAVAEAAVAHEVSVEAAVDSACAG